MTASRPPRPRFPSGPASVLALLLVLVATAGASPVAAQSPPDLATGAIAGRVVDAATGAPLPGARVSTEGTNLVAVTDQEGRFRLAPVPVGEREVTVTYLGYGPAEASATVAPGEAARLRIELTPAALDGQGFGDTVEVTSAPLLEGQAKALNQQKSAINIKNVVASDQIGRFPDPNAAEAAQRIPGISIQRDQGEGRYVLVRGTEARLNAMMVDGERLPSPEGDVRNVALDVIPADLLEAIEVSKALTPDMDADSIGGAVNLITQRAPDTPRLSGAVGGGYNDNSEDGIREANATFGRRFADGRLGFIGSASYLDTDRGSDNFEAEYDDGELDTFELRDYLINRERIGASAALDGAVGETGNFRVSGIYNQFDDTEIRRRVVSAISDDELEREIKDRFESQTIYSVAGRGDQLLAGGELQLEVRLSYAYAEEDEPDALYTSFIQEDVEFDPNVSPDAIDPDDIQPNPGNEDLGAYGLDGLTEENNFTSEDDVVAALDLSSPFYRDAGFSGIWRFGAKGRFKSKDQELEVFDLEAEDDLFLTDFLDRGYDPGTFLDGRYDPGAFFDPGDARRLQRSGTLEREKDFEEDAGDYRVEEDVLAAYAMAELLLGDRLTLLGGLRYESTDTDATGFRVLFDEEGDFVETVAVNRGGSYGTLLPGVHLVYRLDDDSNFRVAATRSLARPNYIDLAPYEVILDEDDEIERGNPDLDVTTSWNLDLLWERYLSSVGVIQAGVFYKSLSDYIYTFRFDELRAGRQFEINQPRNGDDATLYGAELAFQNRFASLPVPWDGLGLYMNYTWTDSEAEFPDRDGEKATLPGQAEHVGNVALFYERSGFSGRLSLNFHGRYIDEVGGDASEDIYYDDHVQLDLSASQRIDDRFSLYLELINLTDEPLRYYEGSSDRPIQEEYYSWWGTLGLRFSL